MDILVSVIIPIYNEEKNLSQLFCYLREIKFDKNKYEILFIDDGSIDNSEDIINKELEKEINYRYKFKSNGGVGSARNLGIQEARGKYICFLDADDYQAPEFIEKMLNKIVDNESNAVFCGHYLVTPESKKKIKTKFKSKDYLLDYFLGNIKAHTDSWIILKSFLLDNNIRFLESSNWGEDYFFFSQIFFNTSEINSVSEYLTCYRNGFDNNRLSSNTFDKFVLDQKLVEDIVSEFNLKKDTQYYDAIKKYRLPTMIYNRILNIDLNNLDENQRIIINSYLDNYRYLNLKYGLPSIKLIIRYIQVSLKLKFLRKEL